MTLAALPEPVFVTTDPAAISRDLIALYETATDTTLAPAQVERLIVDLIAYVSVLQRTAINETAKQNLVRYAKFPMLDHLGEFMGCERLANIAATTTLRYVLSSVQPTNIVIPAGNRVQSKDSKVIFATSEPLTILAGSTQGEVTATATESGIVGNGYLPGDVATILDPLATVATATNTTMTAGGYDTEGDEPYRTRIFAASDAFTVAGPRNMYRSLALGAHPEVVDVFVQHDGEGRVLVYPLTTSGAPSPAVMAAVVAALDPEDMVPLTDSVSVLPPSPIDYTVNVQLTLYTSANQPFVEAAVAQAIDDQAAYLRAALGRDRVPSQFLGAIMRVPGVYNAVMSTPGFLATAPNEFPNLTAQTVATVGVTDG